MGQFLRAISLFSLVLSLLIPMRAQAVFIAFDMDPSTAGIQSATTAMVSDVFSVDVILGDILPTSPLQGFDITIGFSSALLTANSITSGSFLNPPVIPVSSSLTADQARLAEVTIGALSVGEGVIAQLEFQAMADGLATLMFDVIDLSDPNGVAILPGQINLGNITISSGTPMPMPEPSVGGLVLLGLAAFKIRRRNKTPHQSWT